MNYILKYGIASMLVMSLFSCNNDDDINQGGPGSWSNVENGYKYTFLDDGNFSSDRFNECSSGTYLVESNKLILNYDCDGFTAGIEIPEGIFIEEINFESGYLTINPTYVICIEGCEYKFKKIRSQYFISYFLYFFSLYYSKTKKNS